jgi:hypothetical protein
MSNNGFTASVKEKMRKEWTKAGRGKKWPTIQAKEEKRSVATAQFRLDTGHELLGCHLKTLQHYQR